MKTNQKNSALMSMEEAKQGGTIMHAWLKGLIVVACFLSDAVTFYILFDNMFYQAQWLNYFTAAMCAIAINLFPMLVSYILSNRNLSNFEKVMAAVFAVCFLGVLTVSFIIRLNSKAALFGSTSTLTRNGGAGEIVAVTYTTAQTGTAVLMGCMPAITSLIVFGLTYSNPKQSYVNTLKKQQISLQESINTIEADIKLLEQELAEHDLEGMDAARYEAAVETIYLIQLYCQVVARRVLTQKLGTALACTQLMEENSLKELISERMMNETN